jgi:phosphatidate cytidylyltransferase
MLAQRVATAVIGIPLLLATIFIGGALYTIAVAAILTIAALEFYAATDHSGHTSGVEAVGHTVHTGAARIFAPRTAAIVATAGIGVTALLATEGLDYVTGGTALSIAAVFLALVLIADPDTGLRDFQWAAAGIVYIGFLGAHFTLLRDLPDGEDWVLLALLATFAADSFAYFTGKLWGKTRITPRISAGKTLEGTIGGYVAGFLAVLVLNALLDTDMSFAEAFLLAWIFPAFAMVGDLAESLIKRGGGVKDSSELVPGHGGFLDRLDSPLFTFPLVFYFAIWIAY